MALSSGATFALLAVGLIIIIFLVVAAGVIIYLLFKPSDVTPQPPPASNICTVRAFAPSTDKSYGAANQQYIVTTNSTVSPLANDAAAVGFIINNKTTAGVSLYSEYRSTGNGAVENQLLSLYANANSTSNWTQTLSDGTYKTLYLSQVFFLYVFPSTGASFQVTQDNFGNPLFVSSAFDNLNDVITITLTADSTGAATVATIGSCASSVPPGPPTPPGPPVPPVPVPPVNICTVPAFKSGNKSYGAYTNQYIVTPNSQSSNIIALDSIAVGWIINNTTPSLISLYSEYRQLPMSIVQNQLLSLSISANSVGNWIQTFDQTSGTYKTLYLNQVYFLEVFPPNANSIKITQDVNGKSLAVPSNFDNKNNVLTITVANNSSGNPSVTLGTCPSTG